MIPSVVSRAFPWLLRAWWAALPFTVGPALADALHGGSAPVRTVASVGLWAAWAVGLAATLVAHPVSLTTLRVLAPGCLAAVICAAVAGSTSPLAAVWAAVAAALVFAPATASLCVNGPAYANERRFTLRPPAPLLLGPVVIAWIVAVCGLAAGPLLLAAHAWALGGIACVVGLPLAWLCLRSLHQLSKRWVVFVPAGFVVVDPLGLMDAVLIRRAEVQSLHPAPADSNGVDLTQRAPGLALEAVLTDEVDLVLVRPGRRQGDKQKARRLLFTPTLPGAVLEEARQRRLGVR